MNKYSYEKEVYSIDRLTYEIQQSTIITALDHIDALGNNIDIYFKTELSEGDETTLDGLVDIHGGTPMPNNYIAPVEITNIPSIEYTSKYNLRANAVEATCTINTTTDIDLKLENLDGENEIHKYLWGGMVFGDNIKNGDYAQFSVVDLDGIGVTLGWYTQQEFETMGSEYVFRPYVIKQYIPSSHPYILKTESPGALLVGFYLRCSYTSTATEGSAPKIYINYDLHNKDED